MSAVSSFNTQEVHLWNNPQKQTHKNINLPQAYVAPPRLVAGLNSLDMDHQTNLRVKAYVDNVDKQRCDAHIDTWADTTLYSAGMDILVLKPANLDILSGEYYHDGAGTQRINFERPFVTPPRVVVFFRELDTGKGSSTRLKTYTSNIDAKGFTIHLETWADTTLYSATVGWVAYPEDKDYITSGSVNTMEVRPWQNPVAQNHKDINFQGVPFLKKPTVFCALNWLDIAADTNLRIRAYVDNVTTGGMTWHLDSWADTKMWSAGMSYIAFN